MLLRICKKVGEIATSSSQKRLDPRVTEPVKNSNPPNPLAKGEIDRIYIFSLLSMMYMA